MISIQQWSKWMSKGNASIPHMLLENYKKLNLSDAEMMLVIHIHSFLSEGCHFPSFEQLQQRLTCTPKQLAQMLNRLRKEKFIDIKSSYDEEGRMIEYYCLEPLWEKLFRYLTINVEDKTPKESSWTSLNKTAALSEAPIEGEIYKRFEQEFGRPLSPMECETIGMWLDQDRIDPALIFLALKEAVISNKLSLRYIDKILFQWQKLGLKTAEQVQEHTKKFRSNQQKIKGQYGQLANGQPLNQAQSSEQEVVKFPFYNWLER